MKMSNTNIDNTSDIETNINKILAQTNMTYEEASKKLEDHNNDYMSVLYEYYGINKSKPTKPISVNQMIYKEIRNYMNDLENIYKNKQKENNKE